MCNLGASHAAGDVIVFLNDDIVITEEKWLGSMAGQARLPYAGAVGCLLIYPDSDMIQHGGTIDCEDGPNHILQGSHLSEAICRDVVCPSDINAVTAACLAVRKSVAPNDVECVEGLAGDGHRVTRGRGELQLTRVGIEGQVLTEMVAPHVGHDAPGHAAFVTQLACRALGK